VQAHAPAQTHAAAQLAAQSAAQLAQIAAAAQALPIQAGMVSCAG